MLSDNPTESSTTRGALLPTAATDRYFDYCLQPYEPRTSPVGKSRSESILWAALEHAGALSLRPLLLAIQKSLGRDMTVWGVKHAAGSVWVELYFYDPKKEDVRATVTELANTLEPWLKLEPSVPEWVPYMMASFNLKPDTVAAGKIEEVNLYLTGTNAHEGRSYRVTSQQAQLDNTYRFLPPKPEIDEVLSMVKSSMFVDFTHDPTTLARVIIPKLFACKRVCVAKKRLADAIYYSGIDIDQLLFFLRRFDYPRPLVDFVATNRNTFEHIYFDVGIDYIQKPDKTISYPKSSFYGTL